jgi:hypothetical protein
MNRKARPQYDPTRARRDPRGAAALGLSTALLLCALSLDASAAFIASRAALNADDAIDWGQLGGDSTAVGQPALVHQDSGPDAVVATPGGADLYRFDEGGGSYAGNFSAGDALLSTAFDPGPIVIAFARPVAGVGTQVQGSVLGGFNGVISVYDALDNLLETYTRPGDSTTDQDGSALFLGILRGTADIARVAFAVSFDDPGITDLSLTVNQVDLVDLVDQVPAPGTIALLTPGLLGAPLLHRRGRRGTVRGHRTRADRHPG